jgi:hypothetical protein
MCCWIFFQLIPKLTDFNAFMILIINLFVVKGFLQHLTKSYEVNCPFSVKIKQIQIFNRVSEYFPSESLILSKDFLGALPKNPQNLSDGLNCYASPSRPASLVGYPARGYIQHRSRNDFTPSTSADCIFPSQTASKINKTRGGIPKLPPSSIKERNTT